MRIYRHLPEQTLLPSALAIGNFDGMHLGHQSLLTQLVSAANASDLIPAVMTFEPHPREFFTPNQAPARLSSLREKLEFFSEFGVSLVYICRFNAAFSKITSDDFMQKILRNTLNAKDIFVGEDFRFGAKRAGSVADFKQAGFTLHALQQVNLPHPSLHARRVSSTRIREALSVGNLQEAQQMLGRHYSVSGKVVHGAKLGRQLGFPTANVHMRHERPALTGVYAVKLDGLPAVANLGVRPTLAGVPKLMLEVHVLDFSGDLYGCHVHVAFLQKIRDEQKFESLEALKAQIARDVEAARYFFKTMK